MLNQPVVSNLDELHTFLKRLMAIGAVKVDTENGFRFKHHETDPTAPLSPTYVSLRVPENKGALTQIDVDRVARLMYEYMVRNKLQFHGICPVPRAGDPFALALQQVFYHEGGLHVPLLTLEKIDGPEGRSIGKLVKAQGLPRGAVVTVIDDLITRSVSKVEAIKRLRHEGYIVQDCMVLLDRQQGGPEELATHKVKLHSIVGFRQMFELYRECGLVTSEQFDTIMNYQESERLRITS